MYKLILSLIVLSCVYTAVANASCATMGCTFEAPKCYGAAGTQPQCYPMGLCTQMPCLPGKECINVNGLDQCLRTTHCPSCPSDSVCYFFSNTPLPACYKLFGNCGPMGCPSGQVCIKNPISLSTPTHNVDIDLFNDYEQQSTSFDILIVNGQLNLETNNNQFTYGLNDQVTLSVDTTTTTKQTSSIYQRTSIVITDTDQTINGIKTFTDPTHLSSITSEVYATGLFRIGDSPYQVSKITLINQSPRQRGCRISGSFRTSAGHVNRATAV
ncbi:hypothetical protein SAMD00019534_123140 [Acytostelium subglobosum LB1]|uniref:hypothetical protein n=1 Tax=Acytostelium subglobosum LB1 TaxID=1410327 RepID=UPI000644D58E|nr:hypothetical protein SAMD00019534_123140 [Acytostelium subglobosum LB1]GAM29138.1 hypothetical protein SAMD00019534_123140 [Acytostelium subglobosum LB1]|eukprot:XP_012747983.1 hypothetical protein SAMD00019534_123140 [Acytostelium subglobosum LB1]